MRRLLYLAAVSMVIGLVFAPAALALQDLTDGDNGTMPTSAQYAQYDQYASEEPTPVEPALPETGGLAPLLLPATGLLLGAGLIGIRILRRS